MRTRFTTGLKILNVFRPKSTVSDISPKSVELGLERISLPMQGQPPQGGTSLWKAGSGTERCRGLIGRLARRCAEFANSAVKVFSLETRSQLDFAATTVGCLPAGTLALTTKPEAVFFVARNLESTSTPKSAAVPVPVVVAGLPVPAGIAKVYDLTVEGEHEFYANGVLVHNCIHYVFAENPGFVLPTRGGDTFVPIYSGTGH